MDRINGAKPGDVVGGGPQQATHFAVPVPVFQAIRKIMGTMPHDDVRGVIAGLEGCQPMSLIAKEASANSGS